MLTTKYEIQAETEYIKNNGGLTIAVVADLHEENPAEVLDILRKNRPDIITVPGDLFNMGDMSEYDTASDLQNVTQKTNSFTSKRKIRQKIGETVFFIISHLVPKKKEAAKKENIYQFLKEAAEIAPVMVSLGNHDLYLKRNSSGISEKTGAIILNNDYAVVNNIVFGGLTSRFISDDTEEYFLKRFSSVSGYRILLCHNPEYYPEIYRYADLVISGHCHGGQIRIGGSPQKRGIALYAPGQGIFPHFSHGLYSDYNVPLIVSSGCANTSSIPRWGNEEEVVFVKIRTNQKTATHVMAITHPAAGNKKGKNKKIRKTKK